MTKIAAIAIGRNEGDRLIACLDSLVGQVDQIVYVDSGSTDDSVAEARARGAAVVHLDMLKPFTAARARNAGIAHLGNLNSDLPEFVQFIDGDCTIQPRWLETGRAFLADRPDAAVACGRVRERYPERTLWNRLMDAEWDTPIGEVKACGGIALIRWDALQQVGGYRDDLIAGEEPELCVRLRAAGWKIWRLNAEMTLHDAAMTRFGQWWKRSKRAGYAFANGAALHGAPPELHYVQETRRALLWGAGLPALTLIGLLVSPWALMLLVLWPMQIVRLRARGFDLAQATFLTLGKLPEAQGVLLYFWKQKRGMRSQLIEYK